MYPNTDPKPVGAYVRNVHPCGTYTDEGVVTQVSGTLTEGDTLTVATGTGSTCYGPARNWAPTDRRPGWLDRARPEFLAALERVRAELDPAAWTIPADGFADGGTPYTADELELILQ